MLHTSTRPVSHMNASCHTSVKTSCRIHTYTYMCVCVSLTLFGINKCCSSQHNTLSATLYPTPYPSIHPTLLIPTQHPKCDLYPTPPLYPTHTHMCVCVSLTLFGNNECCQCQHNTLIATLYPTPPLYPTHCTLHPTLSVEYRV